MIWSNKELSLALEQNILCTNLNVVQFNSQHVQEGDLFIALPGVRDGHLFAGDALERGAGAVIISEDIETIPKEKKIIVKDTLKALQQLAKYKRENSKAKFIGITGSVGKTSTKEALKLMLEPFGKVFATRGNFNNFLGVPINLASMPSDAEYVVIELGMNHAGEIAELVKLVKPDMAIITNIAEVHIGNFESIYGIINAKSEIFNDMSSDSIVLINNDNVEYSNIVLQKAKEKGIEKSYFFGPNDGSSSKLLNYTNEEHQSVLTYEIKNSQVIVKLDKLPEHYAHNFAGDFLLIYLLGLDLNMAAGGLEKFILKDGRGEIIAVSKGEKHYRIICDYYASNSSSLIAALKSLSKIDHPKKVIVMGDMLELGEKALAIHESIIPYISNSGAYKLILVGETAPKIADKISADIKVYQFKNIDEAIDQLSNILSQDEIILVKGSRKLMMWKLLTFFDK